MTEVLCETGIGTEWLVWIVAKIQPVSEVLFTMRKINLLIL